jgi:subtilisin family serine protease
MLTLVLYIMELDSDLFLMKNFITIITISILTTILVNCGGGGGGDSTTKYTYSETASDHKTTEYNNQYGLASIKAAEGYAALGGYTKGGPIKVAVLDTGIDSDHTQLDGQIASGGYDYVNDDSDPEDNQVGGIGHGTHVSGIIAAELTGTGMHGVCPNCDIIPIKVLNDSNPASGTWGDLASAIDRARTQVPLAGLESFKTLIGIISQLGQTPCMPVPVNSAAIMPDT